MNTIWTLVILYGITWAGPGGSNYVEYPDKASCYEALNNMRITGQSQQSGDDDEQVIAYCKPVKGRN